MPIDILSLSTKKVNTITMDKMQSYIRKNALVHERTQRLKKFQSLEKSFNIKRITIKRPLHYYKVANRQDSSEQLRKSETKRDQQNPISTLESLKLKIKTLENDQISDLDLDIKLSHFKNHSNQVNSRNTQKQVRDMIQDYRKARNRANQFRSQKILKIIQIKKKGEQDKQRPKVKSLQMANKTSNDFMKSVYLKFINGNDHKSMSTKESERPNLSLTAKKFYQHRMTHYRSRTETFWNECQEQTQEQARKNRVKRFKEMHSMRI